MYCSWGVYARMYRGTNYIPAARRYKAVATWWITESLVRKAGCIYGNSRRVIARRTSVHAAAQVLFILRTFLAWHTRWVSRHWLKLTMSIGVTDCVTADSCFIQPGVVASCFFAFRFSLFAFRFSFSEFAVTSRCTHRCQSLL